MYAIIIRDALCDYIDLRPYGYVDRHRYVDVSGVTRLKIILLAVYS